MLTELRRTIAAAVMGGSASKEEQDQHAKWIAEFQGAERFTKAWREKGEKVVQAYLGDPNGTAVDSKSRLNLFYSNIVTVKAMMFSKIPKVETDRRFLDPDDDVARVAAEMMERVLQNDMAQANDTFADVAKEALQDRLLPGLGAVRVKYRLTEKADPTGLQDDTGAALMVKDYECCDFVYTHWEDILWSPCRTKTEMRWVAFRAYMNKAEVEERWGEEVATLISYTSKGPDFKDAKIATTSDIPDRNQAEIWEIWDKDSKQVIWMCKSYNKLLEVKDDPLGLPEFFPDEELMANLTSTKYLPKADYVIAQDLYEEIDNLQTRITYLTEAAKAVGVYDQSNKEVARMFQEGVENTLIPVNNWAMLSDKGGLDSVIDWMPIKDIVDAINVLQQQMQARIALLYQVVGMSDIMRGQATTTGVTATEQKIKAQATSNRLQSMQDEFAEFISNLLNKKAWIVQKFYDPATIIKISNVMNTPDRDFAEQAVALIKSEDFNLRVVVRSDTMAQKDLAAVKADRAEYLQAIAQWVGQTQGMVQTVPESFPFLLSLLRFGLASFESASEMESVIDKFQAQVEKKLAEAAAQPPQPSPEDKKIQGQMQIEQMKLQGEMQSKQADQQLEGQKMQAEMAMERQRFQMEMAKMQADLQMQREEHALRMEELRAKIDSMREQAQIKAQSMQQQGELKAQQIEQEGELKAVQGAQQLEQQAEAHEQSLEQTAIAAKQDQKIKAQQAKAKPAAKKE